MPNDSYREHHEVDNTMMVFSGNANRPLAEEVVGRMRIRLGGAVVEKFSDGEVMVELLDSVRGKDVFVIQPTCRPGNDTLLELLMMFDALKRASAARNRSHAVYGLCPSRSPHAFVASADLGQGGCQYDLHRWCRSRVDDGFTC